jgi:NTE family protein
MLKNLYKAVASIAMMLAITSTGGAFAQESSSSSRPKIGLALGGGGTRGAAHVRVLKVLTEAGIPIDYIAGTSMGAIVGGMYCAGVPLDQIEERFQSCSLMKAFMTVPLTVRLIVAPIMVLPRAIGFHPYDGLYYGNKFRKYMDKTVPATEQNIEELKIPFAAVTTSLIDGKAYSLRTGNFGYALQASSAVPALRKPVQIGTNLFVDGAMAANVPVTQVKEMGADIVIAVNVDESFGPVPLDTFRAMGSVSERVVKMQLWREDDPACKQADVVIHPNVDGISLLSRRRKDAVKAMDAGERAAKDALPAIKQAIANYRVGGEQVSSKIGNAVGK